MNRLVGKANMSSSWTVDMFLLPTKQTVFPLTQKADKATKNVKMSFRVNITAWICRWMEVMLHAITVKFSSPGEQPSRVLGWQILVAWNGLQRVLVSDAARWTPNSVQYEGTCKLVPMRISAMPWKIRGRNEGKKAGNSQPRRYMEVNLMLRPH